jgi:mono/diheme cytochrome c family protein
MDTLAWKWVVAGGVLWLAGSAHAQVSAQRPGDPGLWDYQNSCASCHGVAGRGDGPLAPFLVARPSDLTLLARRHGGVLPKDRVAAMIDGRGTADIGSHGTREMPVWGSVYFDRVKKVGGTDEQAERAAQRRIDDLIDHLERMQRK